MILLQVMTILPSEDIDYVDASPPDAEIVSSEVVEIVIPEVGGIDTDILLTIKDDILSPHSLLSFLEETNTFDNSLLQILKTFCFNSEKRLVVAVPYSFLIYFFPDYERFLRSYEEKSYDFYHEEFADELAHIISPPEYDCFYFKSEPDPCELTSIVDFGIRENVLSTTNVNLPFEDDQSPLWAYVVWIFLSFHTLSVRESSRRTKNDRVKYELDAKQGLFGNLKSSWSQKPGPLSRQGWDVPEHVTNVATMNESRLQNSLVLGNRYLRKGQKQSQIDKTEHEKSVKNFIGQAESKAKIEDLGGQEFLRARIMLGFLSQQKHNKHTKVEDPHGIYIEEAQKKKK
ncbi:hypothetical protein Tco_0218550 [Tanacetum coccineum]